MKPFFPVRSRLASLRLGVALIVLPFMGALPAAAQTVLSFNTLYTAEDLTPFGNNINFNYSTNFSWEQSASFGGFSSGLFGDEYGAGGSAFVRVAAGFNVGFKADTGTVSVKLPNKIRVTSTLTPDDENFGGSITISQDRSGIGSDSFFTTTAPSFGFNLGFHYEFNAGIEGRIAYGFGSTSGELSLATMWAAQSAQNAAMYAAGISPYKTSLDNLIKFDGATGKAAIFNYEFDVPAAGFAKDISANTVTGLNGKTLPTLNRLGRVVINPVTAQLAAASNQSFTTTRTVENVLRGELDMLGIVSSAFGLPINPFDLRAPIAGTPIEVSLKLLSMNPHIGLGVKQTLTLAPNTYLNLTSNHDVTYSYLDSNGQTQTVTTRNMQYLLPNDGSGSTLRIVQVPEAENWQLYSSISIAPQIRNQLFLTITEGFDLEALKAQIGAYGFNASIGPLIDLDLQATQDIPIWDQWNPLSGGTLSRVYRNSIPLYGAGVIQQMNNIAAGEFVNFSAAAGNYSLSSIAGSLYVSDFSLFQVQNLDIGSNGLLHVMSLDAEDSSEVQASRLTVQTGGRLQIDPNNIVKVTSTSPGFVDLDGLMASGTFVLGGALVYNGPDIREIGAGAEIQLLPSDYEADTDVGYRIQNGNHDGLAFLERNAGKLLIAGQNLAVSGPSFTNTGTLALTNSSNLLVAFGFANTGTLFVGKDSILAASTLGSSNLANDTLSNFKGTFGGATGGGQLFYGLGGKPTALASSTDLTFIGTRPTVANGFVGDGFISTGTLGSGIDALSDVTSNAGQLTLTHGASQSFSGDFANTGTINLHLSGLNVAGDFSNTGILNIENYGSLQVGGALVFGENGTLTGTWKLGGTLTHAGGGIQKIAEGASVEILGAGLGFINTAGEYANTWEHFSRLDGALTLHSGASIHSNASLSFGAHSQLTLNSDSQLGVGGLERWDGTLTIGTGATLFTSALPMNANGELNFHELNLFGLLSYSATDVFGIAEGTRVNIRSGGSFYAPSGNGWGNAAHINGTLDLSGGGAFRSNNSFVLGATGTLIMDGNSRLMVTSGGFIVDPGANFQPGGTITLGGGGGGDQATFAINDGFTLDKVRLQLGDVSMVDTYANVNGSGQIIGLGTWTNTGNILGRGAITGGTLINRGTIHSAGVYGLGDGLRLHGFAAPIQNYGTIGSLEVSPTDQSLRTTLHFDGVTVDNLTLNHVTGNLAFDSNALFTNATINNGAINVNAAGAITTAGANLNVDYITVDGSMLVRNNAPTTARGQFIVGYTGTLTLQGATTEQVVVSLDENNNPTYQDVYRTPTSLNFVSGSTLSNRGLLNVESGTTITGVSIDNYGRVTFAGTNTLENLNNLGGVVDVLDGTSLSLGGTSLNNLGLIHVAGENPSTLAHSHGTLLLVGNYALTGGGTIQLGGYDPVIPAYAAGIKPADVTWANAGRGTISAAANSGYTLTVADQNIFGRGAIGEGNFSIDVLAGGRIGAFGNGSVLAVETDANGLRNRGTLEVGAGATLHLSGGAFQSYNATTSTLTEGALNIAGTLKIDSLNPGQPLNTAAAITLEGAATILNGSNQTVAIGNILAGGTLTTIDKTYTLDATSRTFTNAGTLTAGIGSTLFIDGANFTNFSGSTLTGGTYAALGTLKFSGANIVTNAANLTLSGTGTIVDENSQNALRNFSANTGRFTLANLASHIVGSNVSAFTNGGSITVHAGSTLDFGTATLANQNAATYWVAGALKGTHSPLENGAAHLTLYGNAASWTTGTDTFLGPVGPGSTLTLAGGKEAYFAAGTTLNNTGVIEIGSATTALADGSTIRSSGYAMFGAIGNAAYANIAGGTLRYYSGPTDDATTVTNTVENNFYRGFLVDRLGMFGTLDANGAITFGSDGKLDVYGMFTNTLGATSFINHSGDVHRGTLKIVGGVDLAYGLDTHNVIVDYTHNNGATLRLAGVTLAVDSFSMASTNTGTITFNDGARLLDRAGNDLLDYLNRNQGTLTFARTSSSAPINNHTFTGNFTNTGTLNVLDGSRFRTAGNLTNSGSINNAGSSIDVDVSVTNSGTISGGGLDVGHVLTNTGTLANVGLEVASDFFNGTSSNPGSFLGAFSVGRDLTNEAGSTLDAAASSSIGRDFINRGTVDASYFRVGGDVANYGTMTIAGNTFRNLAGTAYASIYNQGTLIINEGTINNRLSSQSTNAEQIFTEGVVSLTANNVGYGGKINIRDASRLVISSDSQLGNASNSNVVTIESGGTLQLVETSLGSNRQLIAQANATLQASPATTGSTGGSGLNGSLHAQGNLTIANTSGSTPRDFFINHLNFSTPGALSLQAIHLKLGNSTTLNGALTGTGSLSFANHTGQSLALNGGGFFFNPANDYTAPSILLTAATGQLFLGGAAGTQLSAHIQNAGTTIVTSAELALGGILSGTGSLEIDSHAALRLYGAQTFTGTTTIKTDATLTLGDNTSLAGAVVNAGTLIFDTDTYGTTVAAGRTFSGNGDIIKQGSATLTVLSGDYLKNLTISGGQVNVGNGDAFSGNFDITNHATLVFNSSGTIGVTLDGSGSTQHAGSGLVSGTISGDGGVSVTNGGTLSLSASNFTGGAFANNGSTLSLTGTSVLSSLQLHDATLASSNVDLRGKLTYLSGDVRFTGSGNTQLGDIYNSVAPTATVLVDQNADLSLSRALGNFAFEVGDAGYLNFTGSTSTNTVTSLQLAQNGRVAFTGGVHDVTAHGDLLGHVSIAADATVRLAGNAPFAADPLAASDGTIALHGGLLTTSANATFGKIDNALANDGTFTRHSSAGSGTTTIDTLRVNTVNVEAGSLTVAHYTAAQTNLSTSQTTGLFVGSGVTGGLALAQNGSFIENSGHFAVSGPISTWTVPSLFTLQKRGAGLLAFTAGGPVGINLATTAGTVSGNAGTTFTGLISGAGGFYADAWNLLTASPGVVTLTNDNTYTGGTAVVGGRLVVGNGGTAGSLVGDVNLASGSTLAFNRAGTYTLPNTLTGTGTLEQAGTGTLVIDSDVGALVDHDNQSATPSVMHQRSLAIANGTLRLDDGATNLGSIANQTALVLNNATADVTVSGNISGLGTVTKQNDGLATLAGNNTHSGATTVNGGTLVLSGSNANTHATIASSATLALTGSGHVGGSIANSGTLALDLAHNSSFGNTVTGNGRIVKHGDGDLYLANANFTNTFEIADGLLRTHLGSAATLASQLTGAGTFMQSGTGTLTLTGGTFGSLNRIVVDSTLRLAGGSDWNTDFTINAGGNLVTALNLGYGRGISGDGSLRIESGRFLLTHGGSIALPNTTTIDAGATLALYGNASVSGPIVNYGLIDFDSDFTFGSLVTGTGSFLIDDNARVTLTAANTNSGGATIAANSTLVLSGNGAVGGTLANNGTLELVTAANTTRTLPAGITGSGTVALSGGGTLSLSANPNYSGATSLSDGTTLGIASAGTTQFSNAIAGIGNLHTGNQGTTILADNATFGRASNVGGDVTVGGGSTLQVGTGGTAGSLFAAHSLVVNGTLAFNHAANHQSQLNNFSGVGTVRVMGSGQRVIVDTDNDNFIGLVRIDSGAILELGTGGTTGSVGVNALPQFAASFLVDGTLRLNRSDDANFNHSLSGSGRLQDLNGDLTLTGPLAFTGLIETSGNLTFHSNSVSSYVGSFSGNHATNLGQLTLVGDTNYTGSTLTNSGILTIGNGASGSFLGTIANTGTLTFNRDAGTDLTVGNLGAHKDITGDGQIVQAGTNTLTISNSVSADAFFAQRGVLVFDRASANAAHATIDGSGTAVVRFIEGNFANLINVSHLETVGTVTLQNVASVGTLDAALSASAGSLTLSSTGTDLTVNGALSGDAAVHFADSGKLTLASGSTNTGALSTAGNFIAVGGGLAASRVDFATAGPNTLEFNHPASGAFGGLVTGLTELRKNGPGSLAFTGTFGDHPNAPVNVGSAITLNVGGGTLDVSDATLNRDLHLKLTAGGTLDIGNHGASVLSLNGTGGSLLGSGDLSIDQIFYSGSLTGFNQLTTQGGELGALNGITSLIKNYNASGTNRLDILGHASGSGLVKINAGDVSFSGTADFGGYLEVNRTGDPSGYTSVTFNENASFGNGSFGDVVVSDADLSFLKNATADYFVVNNGGDLRIGGLATATDALITSFSISGNSYLRFGVGASLAADNDIFLNHSTLAAAGTLTFAADQILSAYASTLTGSFVFHSVIAGSAADTLNFSGDRLTLAGSSAYVGTLNIQSGTLVLGALAAVDLTRTSFGSGTAFDVNGTDWSSDLLNFNQVTLANSAASAVAISSTIGTSSWFGLDGGTAGLTFIGNIAGASAVGVRTSGNIALSTAAFAKIGTLIVQSGTTQVSLAAFANPTSVELIGTGALDLNAAGAGNFSNPLTLDSNGVTGDSVALLNNTGSALTISSAVTTTDSARLATALIGGDDDTTFTGTLSGEGSLTKIGAGTLTFTPGSIASWNATRAGARLGVREGTLVTGLGVLNHRRLAIEGTGTLQITDDASATLVLHTLEGDGSLDLGSRNLQFNQQNFTNRSAADNFTGTLGAFTGALTTTGSVVHNGETGLDFGVSYGTQSYGALTATTLRVNAGDVVVNDQLNVGIIYVRASGLAGSLTTTRNGVTTHGGTVLDANFASIQGDVRIVGGAAITGHHGTLLLEGSQARLMTETGANVVFAQNSGWIAAHSGATLNVTSTFRNTGDVRLYNGGLISGLSTLNQAGGEFYLGSGTLSADRINLTGGTLNLIGNFQKSGSGFNAVTNPGLVMTGGMLTGTGFVLGGAQLNGGTVAPGGNYAIGTQSISSGAVFGGGATLAWDIDSATGTAGTNWDQLRVSGGATSGFITVAATAQNPFILSARSTTGGNVPNFNGNTNYAWTVAVSQQAIRDFSADKFRIDTSEFAVPSVLTGNFGVATESVQIGTGSQFETHLKLIYNWAHLFDVATGSQLEANALAANGAFGGLRKSGDGTLVLAGDNLFTGTTHIDAGTLQIGNGGTSGQILGNIHNAGTLAFNRSNALTHSGVISGPGSVAHAGSGVTTLTAVNTYTGGTALNAGTLAIAADTALGATSGNLTFAGGTLATTASFISARDVTLNAGGGKFDTASGTTLTWTGDISGLGSFTKLGAGTLLLGGSNTYAGTTFVNAGTLRLGSATALSANTALDVAAGATFDTNGYALAVATLAGTGTVDVGSSGLSVSPTGTNAYAGSLTGHGGLTMNGTGTLVLNNASNTFSGPVTVQSGTLEVGATGALPSGLAVSLANAATLNLANHATTVGALTGNGNVTLGTATLTLAPTGSSPTFAGAISGAGGVTVSGNGTVILAGTSTYTGDTTVNTGTLIVNGSNAASEFTVNAGGTLGGSGTVGDLFLGAGSTLAPGNSPGTLHVDGNSVWSGGGQYNWQIVDAAGAAGTSYDLVSISGTLTLAATGSDRYTINLLSLLANDTSGDAINFNSAVDSSYTIASATGGIFGFNTDAFTLNTTGFTNSLGIGSWNISSDGHTVSLHFAAIPEPSTYAMLFGTAVLALAAWRKRRR